MLFIPIFFRVWYFTALASILLLVYGGQELMVTLSSATEPEAIRLEDLESGGRPTQPYVTIGPHYAVYDVASHETTGDHVYSAVYPIVSPTHPWSLAWEALNTKYPNPDDIPPEEVPDLTPLTVLVITDEFERIGDIPDEGRRVLETTGLLLNVRDISYRDRQLVELQTEQTENVVVLELGRKPLSLAASLGLFGTAVALGLVTIPLFIAREPLGKGGRPNEGEDDATEEGDFR